MEIPQQPEVSGDAGKVLRWVNTILLLAGAAMGYTVLDFVKTGNAETKTMIGQVQNDLSVAKEKLAVFNATAITRDSVTASQSVIGDRITSVAERVNGHERQLGALTEQLATANRGIAKISEDVEKLVKKP